MVMDMSKEERMELAKERLKIVGMHCATCAVTIEKASKKLNGVRNVSVSLANEEALIEYDPLKLSLKEVVNQIRKVGYDVYKEEGVFIVENLATVDDESIVENMLLKRPGIVDVKASHVSKTLYVTINPVTITFQEVGEILDKAGYKVSRIESKAEFEDIERKVAEKELSTLKSHVLISIVFTIPIMIYYTLPILGLGLPFIEYKDILGFILSTPVLFIPGRRFYIGAYRALKNGTANMDTLVALGTGSAYIYSLSTLFGVVSGESFFDASAIVITFILIGRYLEARMKFKTGEAVRKMMELQSKKARVLRDGEEVEVNIEDVKVKDIVVIKSGEKIPVDGIIVEGDGYIDESMLTGEPIPVYKKERDPVVAGTILKNGYLKVIATRVGKETVLSQIIKLVKYSQSAKPPIQRLVDRISGYFTWIVIAIAISTFIIWSTIFNAPLHLALTFTASVLLVACPCALGLATPTAIIVGVGKAAEKGIIIRNIEVLEKIDDLTTIVFDKTGTLTEGKPVVTDIIPTSNEYTSEDIIEYAGIAEKGSEHPIGLAIVEKASETIEDGLGEPDEFEYIPGQGIYAVVKGRTVVLGNDKLMGGFEISIDDVSDIVKRLRGEGKTIIYVAIDGALAGLIAISDPLKEDAYKTVNSLKKQGYRIVMLTGDHKVTAEAIASKLGIDEVYAEVSPEDKAEKIKELQRRGEVVAMVGDGINDAPSLTQADIGFAMGGGTDIAKEAGDIIIVGSRLSSIPISIKISRKIKDKIKFNLFWAFIYNVILIPVAAGILSIYGIILRPEYAGAAMAMSSISVTGNALLLKRWNPEVD